MYIQMIRFNRFKRLNESELDHHFDKNEPKKKRNLYEWQNAHMIKATKTNQRS